MPMPIVGYWALDEYKKTDFGRVTFQISTDDLEQYILDRYEQGARQVELDMLETIFSTRVTEENILMGETDPQMSEELINGASLEECLVDCYSRYLQAQGDENRHTTNDEFIAGMRESLWEAGCRCGRLKENVTDEQILTAAKDVFDRKIELITRYRHNKKLQHVPENLRSVISL